MIVASSLQRRDAIPAAPAARGLQPPTSQLRDSTGRVFAEHGGIRLLEIGKFAAEAVHTEQERWVKFFKEGAALDPDHLPPWMNTPEMRQVMSTLNTFSEKDRAYHAYQARQEFLRVQRAMQQDMQERTRALQEAEAKLGQTQAELQQARAAEEQARTAAEHARVAEERERVAKEQALAELARLRQKLDQQNGA